MKISICKDEELQNNQSKKFTIEEPRFDREAFVFKKDNTLYAYYNECPHIGLALDFDDNDFFSEDQTKLVCKNHGAEFNPCDGLCTMGPCADTSLKAISVAIEDGVIVATISPK
ncbi:MAG: Rieske (2Fe-2S) protein [Deltaproteobacteria bacterium]|nr:Rieske (2Fe-2S) protein [Deltaproteobacteria bacterium]